MRLITLYLFTIVITNPYKDIIYGAVIDSYDYENNQHCVSFYDAYGDLEEVCEEIEPKEIKYDWDIYFN